MESSAFFVSDPDALVQLQLSHPHARRPLLAKPKRKRKPKTAEQLRQRRLTRLQQRGAVRVQAMERQNFCCCYCGVSFLTSLSAFISATWDHVVPISAGGSDTVTNKRLVCYGCNQLKAATLVLNEDEARNLIQSRLPPHRHWFTQAQLRASALADKPSLLRRLVRRVVARVS